jgi:dolichol-phosphate mannosyltransferase
MTERDRFTRGLIAWVGFKQVPFHYDRAPRHAGQGKYPLRRMLRLASDAFLGFSMFPVRLAGLLSLTFFVTMLLLIAYVLISWLSASTVPGWTSLAIIVTLASAVQLFTLSVIGEYMGRLYMQAKARPLFIVADSCGGPVPLP